MSDRSLYDLADDLGALLTFGEPKPIERAEKLAKPVFYPMRRDLWPPEVWAEMQRIQRGDDAQPDPGDI